MLGAVVELVRHVGSIAAVKFQFEIWSTARGVKISGNATVLILGSETEHFLAERSLGLTLVSHGWRSAPILSAKVRIVLAFR